MATLTEQLRDLSQAFRKRAAELDAEFIEGADPRAVEGGAHSEEAELARSVGRQLLTIWAEVTDDLEGCV
jgi:hypothetical protein